MNITALTGQTLSACVDISRFSEVEGQITRPFLCASAPDVHTYLRAWADHLGLVTRVDAAGNLRSRREALRPDAPTLYLGSHLDTVPDAGKYDGILGVVLGYALVEALGDRALPYSIEVLGFSEEEGVRFGVPFIGSRALVGTADELLTLCDAGGVPVQDAIRAYGLDPAGLRDAEVPPGALGYFEIHIEQGPVLQDMGASVGVVEAIVGQSRLELTFTGRASHAGTTPMHLRRDALAAAARFMVACEERARQVKGLVATVGMVNVKPGAGNVVPGEVVCSLDFRHARDEVRREALAELLSQAQSFASERHIAVQVTPRMDETATPMSGRFRALLHQAADDLGLPHPELVSGAGHDAQVMAQRMPSAMLFVRSPNALSHHPDEMVNPEDVEDALRLGVRFLERLAHQVEGA